MDRFRVLFLLFIITCATLARAQLTPDVQWGFTSPNASSAVAYSPNGASILTIGDNQVRLWQASTGSPLWMAPVSGLVDAVFTNDSKFVLVSTSTSVRVLSAASGVDLGAFTTDPGAKGFISISGDGATLATSVDGTTVNLYKTSDGTLSSTFAANAGNTPANMQFFTAAGQPERLLVGSNAYNLNGTLFKSFRPATADPALIMRSRNTPSSRVFTIEDPALGTLSSRYAATGLVASTYSLSSLNITSRNLCGGFNSGGSVFAIGGNNATSTAGTVTLFNMSGGTLGTVTTSTAGTFKSLAFSPSTDDFALVSRVGSTSVWKLELFRLNTAKTGASLVWTQNTIGMTPVTQLAVGNGNAGVNTDAILISGATTGLSGNPPMQLFNTKTGARFRSLTEILLQGTRNRQMSVSPDGRFLAVVFNGSGGNLRIYDLTGVSATMLYAGHVTGVSFINNTDLVVDGPTRLRMGPAGVSGTIFNWGARGNIIDPVVSPDGTRVMMMDADTNEFVLFDAVNGGATRFNNPDFPGALTDYGFETNGDFWTFVRSDSVTSHAARLNVYGVTSTALSLKRSRLTTLPVPTGGSFVAWRGAESLNGKFGAFVGTLTDASGTTYNTVRFWRWADSAEFEFQLPGGGAVGDVKFTPDSSMLQFGTSDGSMLSLNIPSTVTGLTVDPTSLFGGDSTTATVTISEPGSLKGTVVELVGSTNLVPPATVTVAPGATQATFTVTTKGVATDNSQSITAKLNGSQKSASVALKAPTFKSAGFTAVTAEGGDPVTLAVIINGRAPAGGLTFPVTLSGPITSPTSVTIPEGASSVKVPFSTAVIKGTAVGKISATLNGTSIAPTIKIFEPRVTGFGLSATEVIGGTSLIGHVQLSKVAPAGGITVTVTKNAAAATVGPVVVPEGSSNTDFTIDTTAVSSDTPVSLSVKTANGTTLTENFTILAPVINSFTLGANQLVNGQSTTATVTLTGPAPAGGYTVSMTSSDPTIVVSDLTILPGTSSGNINVNTTSCVEDVNGTVTATHGTSTMNQPLKVLGLHINSITIPYAYVLGGYNPPATVQISLPAPTGGYAVTIGSDKSCAIGGTLTIPAGKTSGVFTLKTTPVLDNTTATITATHGTSSKSTSLLVKAPIISSVVENPSPVTGGNSVTVTVNLNGAAPDGMTFNMSWTGPASMPTTVTIPAGTKSTTFTITTSTVTVQSKCRYVFTRGAYTYARSFYINP